jgi:LPS-assembly protein
MLPIEFPQYNSIDSIDSQNVVRLGIRNKVQTKREGKVEDVVYWEVFNDWRLDPRTDQTKFSDVYSDLILQPRSWLTLQSITRIDVDDGNWRLALHTLTLQPNSTWSWSIGHFYKREDLCGAPDALGQVNDLLMSILFYRLNENWGFRAQVHYDITRNRLQEQYYTIYRDMRSWTAALSAGLRDNGSGDDEFLIAFTFSLKAAPRFDLGTDTVRPYSLLGR